MYNFIESVIFQLIFRAKGPLQIASNQFQNKQMGNFKLLNVRISFFCVSSITIKRLLNVHGLCSRLFPRSQTSASQMTFTIIHLFIFYSSNPIAYLFVGFTPNHFNFTLAFIASNSLQTDLQSSRGKVQKMLNKLFVKYRAIREDFMNRSPRGKWEFTRNIGIFVLTLTGELIYFKLMWRFLCKRL